MQKTISPEFLPQKIVVISHVFASGPAQALVEYLNFNKTKEVVFIGHPLFYRANSKKGSFWSYYKDGKLKKEIFAKNIKLPSIFLYIKDFCLSIYWVLNSKQRWDLAVCADNLNTLSCIFLRLFKKIKKVVYYTIDYVPVRFKNSTLNNIYHFIDRICVIKADQVWNLSPRMERARKEFRGIKSPEGKQRVVPMGIWYDKIKRIDFERTEKHTLVFMGHLLEKQGVQIVIESIPEIIRYIPDFKFLIIGTGPFEQKLRELTEGLNVKKFVEFTGYIQNYNEMENLIARSSCAVAIYKDIGRDENFTYYADPGKIKDYLGAGLPVILTDVSYNVREIEKNRCGVLVTYDVEDVARAVIDLMKDENKLQTYRSNALKYAKRFDWNSIYDEAFRNLRR